MCKLCNGRYQVSLHYTSILYKYVLYIDTRSGGYYTILFIIYLLYYFTILLLILIIVCVF